MTSDDRGPIPIGEGKEIRRAKGVADALTKCGSDIFSAKPGAVVLTLGSAWHELRGTDVTFTVKTARRYASLFGMLARRAEDLAAEAAGGPRILVALRKRHVERVVAEVAKRHSAVPAWLCTPLDHGAKPSAAVAELWSHLHRGMPYTTIADIWGVKPHFVRKHVLAHRKASR